MHTESRRTLSIAQDHRSAAERGFPFLFSQSLSFFLFPQAIVTAFSMPGMGPQTPRIFFISVNGGESHALRIWCPEGHCTSPKTIGQRRKGVFPFLFSNPPSIFLFPQAIVTAFGMPGMGPQAHRIFFISVDGGERYG